MKNSRSQLTLFILMLAVVACKTTKTQEATTKPVESSGSSQSVVLTEPIEVKPLKLDTTGAKRVKREAVSDSLVMNIRRTPCYGRCPVYSAAIYESGHVVYQGKRFVENEGLHTATMSAKDLESIRQMVLSIKYFDLQDEYDSPVTDLPTTYTTVNIKGQRKTIKNRVGGPDELKALERHVQKILDSLKWKEEGDSGKQ